MKNLDLLLPQSSPVRESWRWGTVVGPGEVRFSGESSVVGVTDSLVPYVPGDRVLVRLSGVRAVIMGASQGGALRNDFLTLADIPENSLFIAGEWWQASGIAPIPPHSWSLAGLDNWWMGTVDMPNPYTPPAGYGFNWSILQSNGFTILVNSSPTTGGVTSCRLMNFANKAPILSRAQWQLVKQN